MAVTKQKGKNLQFTIKFNRILTFQRQIYMAKIKGEDVPDLDISLPPGYVEVFLLYFIL